MQNQDLLRQREANALFTIGLKTITLLATPQLSRGDFRSFRGLGAMQYLFFCSQLQIMTKDK